AGGRGRGDRRHRRLPEADPAELLQAPPVPRGARGPSPRYRTRGVALGAPPLAHRREYFLALDFTLNRELNAALGLPDYRDTAFHLFDLTALDHSQDRERRVAQLLADTRYGIRYYRFPLVLFERGLARRQEPELEALITEGGDDGPGVVRGFPAVFFQVRGAKAVVRDLGVTGHGATLRFVPGLRGEAGGPGASSPPRAAA